MAAMGMESALQFDRIMLQSPAQDTAVSRLLLRLALLHLAQRSAEQTMRALTMLPVSALLGQMSQTLHQINCILLTYVLLPGNKWWLSPLPSTL